MSSNEIKEFGILRVNSGALDTALAVLNTVDSLLYRVNDVEEAIAEGDDSVYITLYVRFNKEDRGKKTSDDKEDKTPDKEGKDDKEDNPLFKSFLVKSLSEEDDDDVFLQTLYDILGR